MGLEFHAGNANMCILGEYDLASHRLLRECIQAIDYGLDFYAPQTLKTFDGRRVMIGWMQNWETSGHTFPGKRFMGQMTIPRELTIRNGRLCQVPVRELESCRNNKVTYQNVQVAGETSLQGIRGRFLDLTVTVRPQVEAPTYRWFQIDVAGDEHHFTSIRFTPTDNLIRIDRSQSGLSWDIVNVREFPIQDNSGEVKFRMILDRYSLEVFINDGEQAASNVIYTSLEAQDIRFSCDGAALIDVEQYDLELN